MDGEKIANLGNLPSPLADLTLREIFSSITLLSNENKTLREENQKLQRLLESHGRANDSMKCDDAKIRQIQTSCASSVQFVSLVNRYDLVLDQMRAGLSTVHRLIAGLEGEIKASPKSSVRKSEEVSLIALNLHWAKLTDRRTSHKLMYI
jgi:hypothetical protein